MNEYKMNAETYLKDRVDAQLGYYERQATRAKRTHISVQTTIIALGILMPVIINVPTDWGENIDVGIYARILITAMSLLVALLTGISNFRKYGDLWLTYRMTEELLKTERFLFLTGSSKYKNAENPFSQFVQSIEAIISSEHIKFRTIIEESRRPAKDDTDLPDTPKYK